MEITFKKSVLKRAAKIYAANVVRNALGCGAYDERMSELEHAFFVLELDKIADKISELYAGTIEESLDIALEH